MLTEFKNNIEGHNLFRFGERILLAVSGGVDSVVMAHLFAEVGYACGIAHCNFQLRGADSDRDEQFVRSLGGSLEMPVYVERFDVERETKEKGISIQMAARDLRYQWFQELADQHGFDTIATAHNLNDSVETTLLNLTRGTGIRGLPGIPLRNGRVIRPILFATRKEIESYARLNNISFREDASNRETKYQRNKIRHDVIPSLEQINPGFLETMSANMCRMGEIVEILDHTVTQVREVLFKRENGRIMVTIEEIRKLKPIGTWLFELFSPFGFSQAQCESIQHIFDADSGKRFISPTHQLFKDRNHLILVETKTEVFDRYYLDSPDHLSSLPFSMDVEIMDRADLKQIPGDRNTACLDYNEIQFPLTIRHWLHGDHFVPLGMDQMKKVSDFFVDEKVSVPEKERTWILAYGKKIAWIMGHRIDNRFRITEKTKRVLLLRLQSDVGP
jgi:tRNA(Ile)-lysidine synthase